MRPYLWMLCGAFAFATMSAFAHALGKEFAWQIVASVRAAIPLVLSAVWAHSSGVRLVFWKPWTLWWRSIAGSISLVLAFYAFTRQSLPIADVITLTNLFPIWIAIFSWPILGHVPPLRVWLAIGTGVVGVVIVQQPHLAGGDLGILAALISSVFAAFAMLGLNRLQQIHPLAIVFHFSLVAFLLCLGVLISLPHGEVQGGLGATGLACLSGVGLFATLGQLMLTKAYTLGNPSKVSVVALSQVVFGMLYDLIIWHRQFEWIALAGIGLVIAPAAWLMLGSREAADTHPAQSAS